MIRRTLPILFVATALACGGEEKPAAKPAAPAAKPSATAPAASALAQGTSPDALPKGLMLALAPFEVSPEGKVLPKPTAARAEILIREGGAWKVASFTDPESNVFHKVMAYAAPDGPAILTLGGTKAALKLWRKNGDAFAPVATLWTKDFGGKFSRMRDAEIADVRNDGANGLAVATHDQGVVATVEPKDGAWSVSEIDAEKDTFVHEIEVGDLDGDGVVEIYATPSEPNKLDGSEQSGHVTRYVPAKQEGRIVVADLGNRHAKEILVKDVDGDGRDELYVAVEAHTEGTGAATRIVEPVEIRRYDAGSDPTSRTVIATLEDRLCRFLTAGDVDGDGKKEMVAAGFKSGLWLLRPGADPKGAWKVEQIDASSSGFEHASILADLDGDNVDELYVASDDQGEVRRYVLSSGKWTKEVIHTRTPKGSAFTWNIMPVGVELVQ
jgi:hypothetical protein